MLENFCLQLYVKINTSLLVHGSLSEERVLSSLSHVIKTPSHAETARVTILPGSVFVFLMPHNTSIFKGWFFNQIYLRHTQIFCVTFVLSGNNTPRLSDTQLRFSIHLGDSTKWSQAVISASCPTSPWPKFIDAPPSGCPHTSDSPRISLFILDLHWLLPLSVLSIHYASLILHLVVLVGNAATFLSRWTHWGVTLLTQCL